MNGSGSRWNSNADGENPLDLEAIEQLQKGEDRINCVVNYARHVDSSTSLLGYSRSKLPAHAELSPLMYNNICHNERLNVPSVHHL